MLCKHYTEEILGLQGIKVTKVENSEEKIEIYKVVTIKSRFSSAMLTATKILNASETVFYISFLISIF